MSDPLAFTANPEGATATMPAVAAATQQGGGWLQNLWNRGKQVAGDVGNAISGEAQKLGGAASQEAQNFSKNWQDYTGGQPLKTAVQGLEGAWNKITGQGGETKGPAGAQLVSHVFSNPLGTLMGNLDPNSLWGSYVAQIENPIISTHMTQPSEKPMAPWAPLSSAEESAVAAGLNQPSASATAGAPQADATVTTGSAPATGGGADTGKVALPTSAYTLSPASPDYRTALERNLSWLKSRPQSYFGAGSGIFGGLADMLQQGGMSLIGHPEAGRETIAANNRAAAIQNVTNAIASYKNAANLQNLVQQFTQAYYQNLQLPGSQALKMQELSNNIAQLWQQTEANAQQYGRTLQYLLSGAMGPQGKALGASVLARGGQAFGAAALPGQAGGVTPPGAP